VKDWLRWIFRRGVRGSLLLNMRPGDYAVSMIQYRQYLCVLSREGELYLIDGERLVEFREAEIQNVGRERLPDSASGEQR
jgi:hypothetical protein